jgi:GTP-binding protein Era
VSILGDSQNIFVDTPGLFKQKRRLDRAMVKAAWSGAVDADIIVFLIEANRGVTDGVKENLKKLGEFNDFPITVALAINKIDRVKSEELLKLTREINEEYEFEKTFLISAKRGHGVQNLKEWLAGQLPTEAWLYPEDQIADLPLRMIMAEIMREKLTLRLHQELPYQLTVETEGWEERSDGSVKIDQLIYVARDGHKGIILGPNGATIKSINMAARKEMEIFLEKKVHLFCLLKVRPKWLDEKDRYSEMGLSFNDGDL